MSPSKKRQQQLIELLANSIGISQISNIGLGYHRINGSSQIVDFDSLDQAFASDYVYLMIQNNDAALSNQIIAKVNNMLRMWEEEKVVLERDLESEYRLLSEVKLTTLSGADSIGTIAQNQLREDCTEQRNEIENNLQELANDIAKLKGFIAKFKAINAKYKAIYLLKLKREPQVLASSNTIAVASDSNLQENQSVRSPEEIEQEKKTIEKKKKYLVVMTYLRIPSFDLVAKSAPLSGLFLTDTREQLFRRSGEGAKRDYFVLTKTKQLFIFPADSGKTVIDFAEPNEIIASGGIKISGGKIVNIESINGFAKSDLFSLNNALNHLNNVVKEGCVTVTLNSNVLPLSNNEKEELTLPKFKELITGFENDPALLITNKIKAINAYIKTRALEAKSDWKFKSFGYDNGDFSERANAWLNILKKLREFAFEGATKKPAEETEESFAKRTAENKVRLRSELLKALSDNCYKFDTITGTSLFGSRRFTELLLELRNTIIDIDDNKIDLDLTKAVKLQSICRNPDLAHYVGDSVLFLTAMKSSNNQQSVVPVPLHQFGLFAATNPEILPIAEAKKIQTKHLFK